MQTIDDAWHALRRGDRVQAELVASQLARSAAATHGPDTPGHAFALGQLASVRVALGDVPAAIHALRRAAAVDSDDPLGLRAQLTYIMNLGELLGVLGRHDEAVELLQAGLVRRRAFYGDHPGVGYGLQALADAQLADGQLEAATTCVEEARRIFIRHRHPELLPTLALRAETRAARRETVLLTEDDAKTIGSEGLRALVRAVLARADRTRSPARLAIVVQAIRRHVMRDLSPDDETHAQLLTTLSNLARSSGDAELRGAALVELLALYRATDRPDAVHEVTLALALADSEGPRPNETEARYEAALARARDTSDPERARSRTLRNYALWLVEVGRVDEAEPMLLAATDVPDPLLRGQALAVLGQHYQHQGAPQQAERELRRALELLPPDDPDALQARRHLALLDHDEPCPCDRTDRGLADALHAIVRPDLPDGLLDGLTVDARGHLQAHLLREASDAEVEHLWRVLRQGIAQLRHGARNLQ